MLYFISTIRIVCFRIIAEAKDILTELGGSLYYCRAYKAVCRPTYILIPVRAADPERISMI